MKMMRDIAYYEDNMPIDHHAEYARERCKLDIAIPDHADQAPVAVFFHGGGMTGGEKRCPETLVGHGWVTVGVNYRLSSERAKCPDYLYDAAAAVAWVFRHIAEYGGSPERVMVTGQSAGAYLAAMIGMDGRYLRRFDCDHQKLLLIAPISGQMTTHFQIVNERNGTSGLATGPGVIDEYAPIFHAAGDLPPIALITGDSMLDMPTRAEENLLLAATLRRLAGHQAVSCINLPGFGHGDIGAAGEMLLERKMREALALRERERCRPAAQQLRREPVILPLQKRLGGICFPEGVCSMAVCDGELQIRVQCREPEMTALQSREPIWNDDCVELWLENGVGQMGQWIVAHDGRSAFVSHGMKKIAYRTKHGADAVSWWVEIGLPLAELQPGKALKMNLFRRREVSGAGSYTNLSPVYGDSNAEKEAFFELLLPEGQGV